MQKPSAFFTKYGFLVSILLVFTLFFFCVPHKTDTRAENAVESNRTTNTSIENIPQQIFSPDWGVISSLLALNKKPYAMGEIDEYNIWAKRPTIPEGVEDIGLRFFPNAEMIKYLDVDLIIDTDFYSLLRPVYPKNTPVVTVNFSQARTDKFAKITWSDYKPSLITINKNINPQLTDVQHSATIDTYIEQKKERIRGAGNKVKAVLGTYKKFVVVKIYDSRSIEYSADNSVVQLAMDTMDLPLFFQGKPSRWGSAQLPIDSIFAIPEDTCFILAEPLSPFVKNQLQNSLLWQKSFFSKADACVYSIEPFWTMNGVEAAVAFSESLADSVTNNHNILMSDSR